MSHPRFVRKAPKDTFTLRDLEAVVGVSAMTIRRWASQGRFPKPAVREGRGKATLWRVQDVLAWLAEQHQA
jgi:predicted DNA-binding transcriptional regulator AlpA